MCRVGTRSPCRRLCATCRGERRAGRAIERWRRVGPAAAAAPTLLQQHTALQAHLPDAVFSQPALESSSSLQGDGSGAGGSWRAAASLASISSHDRVAEVPLHAPRPLLGQDRGGGRQQREQERPPPPHDVQSDVAMLDPRPDRPVSAVSCRRCCAAAAGPHRGRPAATCLLDAPAHRSTELYRHHCLIHNTAET